MMYCCTKTTPAVETKPRAISWQGLPKRNQPVNQSQLSRIPNPGQQPMAIISPPQNTGASRWVQLFGPELLDRNNQLVSTSSVLASKTVWVYFSAHWCYPCRVFSPQLFKYYLSNLKDPNVEIVFVSSDYNNSDFQEYFENMPWPAIPFENLNTYHPHLQDLCQAQGIPKLVRFTSSGEIHDFNGRDLIDSEVKKLPLEMMIDTTGHIQQYPTVVMFMDENPPPVQKDGINQWLQELQTAQVNRENQTYQYVVVNAKQLPFGEFSFLEQMKWDLYVNGQNKMLIVDFNHANGQQFFTFDLPTTKDQLLQNIRHYETNPNLGRTIEMDRPR